MNVRMVANANHVELARAKASGSDIATKGFNAKRAVVAHRNQIKPAEGNCIPHTPDSLLQIGL